MTKATRVLVFPGNHISVQHRGRLSRSAGGLMHGKTVLQPRGVDIFLPSTGSEGRAFIQTAWNPFFPQEGEHGSTSRVKNAGSAVINRKSSVCGGG